MPTVQEQIREKITGMLYLSESEAGLELLEWPDVPDIAALHAKIAGETGQNMLKLRINAPDEALTELQGMADPADPVMMAYIKGYRDLFTLLKAQLRDLTVIRAGQQPVHIYIAGFTDQTCLAVHTTAVET